jgi:3-deoxy-7-phosphoheptulonate synthase
VAGRQELIAGQALVYGQSITDGCIDWSASVDCLERLAAAVSRRGTGSARAQGLRAEA